MKKKSESTTYKAMLADVEKIVEDISSTDLDLDELVENIERGYSLIKTMREKLSETKEKIEKLRVEYEKEVAEE